MKLPPLKKRPEARRMASVWLTVAAWLLCLTAARADSPATDFSATANPNGVWSYGYSQTQGGPFILFTTTVNDDGLVGWNHDIASGVPLILYNGTADPINYSTITLDPGEVSLHPGPDDETCLLRYTAPTSGQYSVTGMFYGRDQEGTTTDVHLLVNGTSVFDGDVNGYGPGTGPSFNQTVVLGAGDTLDFAVGYGTDGNYFDDTTALSADVTYQGPVQPTVAITSPPTGTTVVVGATVPLAASIINPDGLPGQVQFFIDGAPVDAALTAAPFVTSTTVTTPGTYTLTAVLTDDQSSTTLASEMFTVVAANPQASAPTAALLTPLAGRNLPAGSTQTITFQAAPGTGLTTPNLSVVSLYVDGALIASFDGQGNPLGTSHAPTGGQPIRRDAATGPTPIIFQTTYQMPGIDKIVNMLVTALDELGQTTISGVASIHATVTDDVLRQVVFGGLDSGATVITGSTYDLSIYALDPGMAPPAAASAPAAGRADAGTEPLALLEYYVGLIGQSLGPNPSYPVTFQPPTSGKYVMHAVATDSAGLASISEPLIVDAVAPPTVDLAVGGAGAAVEGGANGIVVVTRTGGDISSPLTVSYKAKGAAKAGVDYKALPGTVTIPAGAAKAKIKIKPINGSPNAGTLKLKLVLLPSIDDSYAIGVSPIKIKLIGK